MPYTVGNVKTRIGVLRKYVLIFHFPVYLLLEDLKDVPQTAENLQLACLRFKRDLLK